MQEVFESGDDFILARQCNRTVEIGFDFVS